MASPRNRLFAKGSARTGDGSWSSKTDENSGTVLDYAPDPKKPDAWQESDGSAGLRGYLVKSDKYAEAKAILSSMISAGAVNAASIMFVPKERPS
jgi:hypothetical protein